MDTVTINVKPGADLPGFRAALRSLIATEVSPECVAWQQPDQPQLLPSANVAAAPPVVLSRQMVELIELVVCHRDPERYALLYEMTWRLLHGEPALLDIDSDPLVFRVKRLAKTIRRDLHKMHAFLRFRPAADKGDERFIAWFEPDHYILEATANFFVDRFRSLTWSILTPLASLHWDRRALTFGPPGDPRDVPKADEFEAAWNGYYQSTFNPARLNVAAMQREMPKKYWRNMPETRFIPELVQAAGTRTKEMVEKPATAPRKPIADETVRTMLDETVTSLNDLNAIIAKTEPFVHGGTRAVLGEGPRHPDLAFVGEQPGDQEDLEGHPFVGPAGQLLNRALEEAGIDRKQIYLTNAVKHFKFEQRGKRRIHQTPTVGEVKHYRWWLLKELELVQPRLIVTLGSTAALAVNGKALSVMKDRGPHEFAAGEGYITVHPSYLLRIPDADKADAYRAFVSDLRAAEKLAHHRPQRRASA